jgi:hypothetical protein
VSFRREHGRVVFVCDKSFCPAEAETREGIFTRAVAIVKAKGWTVRYQGWPTHKWRHYCPEHGG